MTCDGGCGTTGVMGKKDILCWAILFIGLSFLPGVLEISRLMSELLSLL